MPDIELTLGIDQYAQQWHLHLGESKKSNLTKTVEAWKEYWPDCFTVAHPSPRNNLWLKKNPWFENEVTPALKQKISQILNL